MRVNIYAEEMTERVAIISKEIEGQTFTGLRLYLELPVTLYDAEGNPRQASGPFMHHPGDDDSAAITFWGKRDLRVVLRKMLAELDAHYANVPPEEPIAGAPTSDFETAAELWQLLDDIDSLDDSCKGDNAAFRSKARAYLKDRHRLLESDGYKLYRPGTMPKDNVQPVEPKRG